MGTNCVRFYSDKCPKTALVIIIGLLFWTTSLMGKDDDQLELVDKIVAVVNGHPILHSYVKAKVAEGNLVAVSDFPLDDKAAAYDRALQDSVNLELIKQKAVDLEIEISETDTEQEIDKFLGSRNLDRASLLKFLKEQRKTFDEYKKDFKDQMIFRRFQGKVIYPLIKITDKDVETYYLKKVGISAGSMSIALRQIWVKVPDNLTLDMKKAKQELVQSIHQKLIGGMDFKEAAKVYSDDSEAKATGGLMPKLRLKELAEPIKKAIETLEPGQFSSPVKINSGYYLFYMEEKSFADNTEFQKSKKDLEIELQNVELYNQTRKWLSEERQRAKVETF